MTHLDKTLGRFEQGLNIAGYVPLFGVGSIAGGIRAAYGKMEVVCSIGRAAITAIAALFNPDVQQKQQGLDRAVEIVKTYTVHGLGNVVRGWVEMVPYLSLVTCLPYDYLGYRFSYPQEGAPEFGVHRLRRA